MSLRRLSTITLTIIYCFSAIGWSNFDMSVKSGCRCSEKAQSENTCCCSAKANQKTSDVADKSCCSSKSESKASCCSQKENSEGPVISSCSCGGKTPQGVVTVSDPRSLLPAVAVVGDNYFAGQLLFQSETFLNVQLPPETPPPRA